MFSVNSFAKMFIVSMTLVFLPQCSEAGEQLGSIVYASADGNRVLVFSEGNSFSGQQPFADPADAANWGEVSVEEKPEGRCLSIGGLPLLGVPSNISVNQSMTCGDYTFKIEQCFRDGGHYDCERSIISRRKYRHDAAPVAFLNVVYSRCRGALAFRFFDDSSSDYVEFGSDLELRSKEGVLASENSLCVDDYWLKD